jgi:hypothetical protein
LTDKKFDWAGDKNLLKAVLGKSPIYKRTVHYAYSPHTNSFTFFTADDRGGLGMMPIGVFSPIETRGITYDPEGVVEEIADMMATFENEDCYDIDSDDNS